MELQKNYANSSVGDSIVLDLYHAIHSVKGKCDDSKYAKVVCAYYEKELKSYVSKRGFDCRIALTDIPKLEIALTNVELLDRLYGAITTGFDEGADFRKLSCTLEPKMDLGNAETGEQLRAVIGAVEALPKTQMYYGKKYTDSPTVVLGGVSQSDSFRSSYYTAIFNVAYDQVSNGGQYANATSKDNLVAKEIVNAIGSSKSGKSVLRNKTIRKYAEEEAKRHIAQFADEMISLEEIVNAYITAIQRAQNKYNNILMAEDRGKRISFFIGLGAWVAITAVFVTLFFVFKDAFAIPEYNGNGFWANFGLSIAGILITLIFAGVYFGGIAAQPGVYVLRAPVFPRGLCTLMVVLRFVVGIVGGELGKYGIPFYIVGAACLIAALFADFSDMLIEEEFGEKIFTTKMESIHRGQVWFSPAVSCVPMILFLAFPAVFGFLNVAAAWVLAIWTALTLMIALMAGRSAAREY